VSAEYLITSPQDGDELGKGAHDIADVHSLEEETPGVWSLRPRAEIKKMAI
jgi:hypothetical protein